MAHTYSSCLYHCVFSTKERAAVIPSEIETELWDYIGGIARQDGFKSLRVGGTANHLHVLLSVPPSMPVAKAMQFIKGLSSKWLNEGRLKFRFAWQEAYGVFTIGVAQIESTVNYIETQKEHHAKYTFEQEYIAFLKKNGVEYDPKYIWG